MDKYVGKRLDGRYEIRELIGVGGMAYVYKAYDNIDDRIVAVKILKDEYLANEEFTRRFKNESKAIAILSHPNIVKVFDVSFGDRIQYIVMEYIDGITLKEYIDQQKEIRWKEALHFTVQILRALQHAHDKGIVHRDIKPQNIMLLPDGTIKVTDFGIARFSRNEIRATGATDKAIGSVHYISPEQARGEITDEKADIYSTGVMLYEMLTGRLPFEADNAVSVAIMQMQSAPRLPREINPEIPEGLEEITMKAMQKDPEKRYQSAAEMLADIDEFKRNPSIHFEYQYFKDETPTKFVEAIVKVKGENPEEDAEAETDEAEEEEEKKGPPVLPILAAIAGAFVVVGLIFAGIIFVLKFSSSSNTESILVENFVGKNYETDILGNPEYTGKYKFETETRNDSEVPAGVVLEQNIDAGSSKKPVVNITLTISLGKRLVEVPEVTAGEHKDEVTARLRLAGFEVQLAQMTSTEVAKDFVIKTMPAFPNKAEEGSTIVVYVSTGEEEPDPVKMPNVEGMELNAAVTKLREAGFVVDPSKAKKVNHDSLSAGWVISQSTQKDKEYAPGTEVELTVSSGFKDVKNVRIPLPNTSTTVDLQFFINGHYNKELSEKYTKIIPNQTSLVLNFTEQQNEYTLTVKIAVSGTNQYSDYITCTLNGLTGQAQIGVPNEFVDPASTTTQATTTTSTTTTTEPTTEDTHPSDSAPDPEDDLDY